jgi:uncharacterized protein (DUF58 family)
LFIAPLTAAGGITTLLACVLTFIGVRAGNTWLLLVGCALFAPVLVSELFRPGLDRISICFIGPDQVQVGRPVPHVLHVHNRGRRSTPGFRLTHALKGFELLRLSVPELPPGGRADVVVHRSANRRGVVRTHDLLLQCTAPFGMATYDRRLRAGARIVVHPAPGIAADLTRPGPGSQEYTGGAGGAGWPPHELREWRPGDPARQVHRRASARADRLIVVIPEVSVRSRLALVVTGPARGRPGVDPDWEELLSTAASSVVALLRHDGGRAQVRLSAADHRDYLGNDPDAVLDWFAELGDAVAAPTQELIRDAVDWAGPDGMAVLAARGPVPGLVTLGPDGLLR